jgi:pyrimidine deaminase RibD-like protein
VPRSLSAIDEQLLSQTLELATRDRGRAHPDPFVGSLIASADGGDVVGRGSHSRYGGTHAEPLAIVEAGERVIGATLYCNLEPCSYEAQDKRQPPCTRAIISAGITRVVIGQIDPHPRVRGDGVRRLREAGIHVDLSPDPLPFWRTNPVFTTVMSLGRPFVHVLTRPDRDIDDALLHYEQVTSCGSVERLSTSARSILIRCADPRRVSLPAGWQVDFIDGRPTEQWGAALRDAGEVPDADRWSVAPRIKQPGSPPALTGAIRPAGA